MPETLERLVLLDTELRKDYGRTIDDYIGFYISFNNDEDRYYCTPNDSIVFGRTGVNGDHFAFYTFKGSTIDLEEAPIIFIQPMSFGNEISLVARNLKDFLSLFVSLREIYILERFRFYNNKMDFINDYNENYFTGINSRESDLYFFIELLREKIKGIKEINDVYKYITELRKQLKLEIDKEWDI
ncbi:hypothetical protein [Paenibacillus sp. USDA918EY]|uniref:SMI1/KNR4 family protein n=2 Tax=Paenibacillus albilobatus TaxID=2716884 RepID=A0A919XI29_9BACL|nr:hypothetical protein [Paenibacillus sp. USDA918EY]GIO31778.1 hypothetical protein J2TS6_29190 [Paenibacillus albilobatus]